MNNMADLLIEWYHHNKRDLPFRHTSDPYLILVSEIMLQQTAVQTVLPYYQRFIHAYPTVNALAAADLDDVYKLWQGLGYYRRAKNLYLSAKMIMTEYGGQFPDTYSEIIKLKGVGPYTASAICAFAFGQEYAAVDGNALRVLSRFYDRHENIAQSATVKRLTADANALVKGHDAASFNQGMMDLGSRICTPRKPSCAICPLVLLCQGHAACEEDLLPVNIKKTKKSEHSYITGLITYQDRLMLKKNQQGLLENMYCLIQYEVDDPYQFVKRFKDEYHQDLTPDEYIKDFKHVFTHQIWLMHVYHFHLTESNSFLLTKKEIKEKAVPTAHHKILRYVSKHHELF